MEKVEISVNEEGAPEVERVSNLRRLQPESLERHRAVRWLNCGWWYKVVPEATFNCVLKSFFLTILSLSVLSDILLGQLLRKDNLPNSGSSWKIIADLTWVFISIVMDWRANVAIIIFAAIVYVGVFLWKLKKSTCSAPQREEQVQTISASIKEV